MILITARNQGFEWVLLTACVLQVKFFVFYSIFAR